MAKLRVLFIGGSGVISSASAYQTPPARMPVTESTPLRNQWYLAEPARQVADAALDAVMDKLAAAWTPMTTG